MVKHIYLALAALVILAIAVNAAPAKMDHDEMEAGHVADSNKAGQVSNSSADSDEDDNDDDKDDDDDDDNDDDDDDDKDDAVKHDAEGAKNESVEEDDDDVFSFIRIRREAVEEPAQEPSKVEAETETEQPAEAEGEAEAESSTPQPASGSAVPTTRKPVLVLIRDALNKVTTGLPTEQVANNALQYFQLFQHFIQQTIEQVIDAAEDDEDETTPAAVAPAAATEENKKPETEDKEPAAEDKEPAAEDKEPEKHTDKIEVPEVPTDEAVKPAEPAVASNVV